MMEVIVARNVFEKIAPDVFLFEDTCNVYVLREGKRCMLIDCGSGDVLDHLAEIGVRKADWILFTHHHREQCQGAKRLADAGAKLAVPAGERMFFDDVEAYWARPERFGCIGAPYVRPLRESVPVARSVGDGENFRWRKFDLQACAAPGHSPGGMYYLLDLRGRCLAFSGDTALAKAKLHNYYDSEWDYGYAAGHIELLRSIRRLLREAPDVLCPARGPIELDPVPSLRRLGNRLHTFIYSLLLRHWDKDDNPFVASSVSVRTPIAGIRRVSEHLFKGDRRNIYILLADSGRALLMDAGVPTQWLDEKVRDMRRLYGLKKIDAVTISHYHGDHLGAIPHVRRRYGAEVWCFENMVEIIEHPERFNLTCLTMHYRFPFTGIPVDSVLADGEDVEWEGFRLRFFHLPGQTEFAMGVAAEIDGWLVAFTGDNMFCSPKQSGHDAFIARNRGILENGYLKCADVLAELKPDLILGQHAQEIPRPGRQIRQLKAWALDFRRALKQLSFFPEYEYFIDPYWVNHYPYRSSCKPGESFPIRVTVANHGRRPIEAHLRLCVPKRWKPDPTELTLEIPRRGKAAQHVEIAVPRRVREGRYVLTTDVTVDGRRYGELFDCLVDVSSP